MIELHVAGSVQAKVKDIYQVLRDYTEYRSWWPLPVRTIEGVASYFEFSPLPLITIGLKENYYLENKVVQFKYVKGPFMGIGRWEIKESGRKGHTLLSYHIKLKSKNRLIGYMAHTALFRRKLSRDINNIIQKLEMRVSEG